MLVKCKGVNGHRGIGLEEKEEEFFVGFFSS